MYPFNVDIFLKIKRKQFQVGSSNHMNNHRNRLRFTDNVWPLIEWIISFCFTWKFNTAVIGAFWSARWNKPQREWIQYWWLKFNHKPCQPFDNNSTSKVYETVKCVVRHIILYSGRSIHALYLNYAPSTYKIRASKYSAYTYDLLAITLKIIKK